MAYYSRKHYPDFLISKIKRRKNLNTSKQTKIYTAIKNVNWQTSIHTDKGDDSEGFGNLVVLEEGKYPWAETCYLQYGYRGRRKNG